MEENNIVVPAWTQEVLLDKCAVVTGGTSGIGYCISKTFLIAGCKKLIITSRSQSNTQLTIEKLRAETQREDAEICGCIMNLSDFDRLEKSFDIIKDKAEDSGIDIWVNNAGIYQGTRFGEVTEKQWDDLMNINLKAQYFLCQYISNYMIENGIEGNILNICSSSSMRPSIDPYMLSKQGMSGLTLGMAKKLIKHAIVVNGIAPGPTFTPMLHKKDGDSIRHGGVPAGRYVLPQEIANLAVFLVSPMGRMIVGDVVKMTGGSAVTTFDDVRY